MFFPRTFFKKYRKQTDQPTKRRQKSKTIKYDSDESVKSALLEMAIFFIFLIATTVVANASHHLYMFYFNQTLEKLFIGQELETNFGVEARFEELVTTADWWSFLETKFLDDFHGEVMVNQFRAESENLSQTRNDSENETHNTRDDFRRLVLRNNILLGPPRLRQIRVKEYSCHVNEAFVRYFNSCYSEYSRGVEDHRPIFKGKQTDQPTKRRQKSKTIKYDSDESVKSALLEMAIFFIFLIATTVVANASHHLYMFYFNQTLEKLFIGQELETNFGVEARFEELVTTADWWSFLETKFLDDFHGEVMVNQFRAESENLSQTRNDSENETHNTRDDFRRLVLRNNILLGPPRLRQIRVKEYSCHVNEAFVRYFNSCYSEYSRGVEDHRPIFKGTNFYTMSQLNVNPVRGEIKRYYGAGYVQSLSFDRSTNEKIFAQLKSSKWIDRGTRLIILEFVLYNSNALMFDNAKIIAELPPVGGIITSHQFQAMKLHSIWSKEKDYGIFVLAIIFYIMVLFYTYEEFAEIIRIGCGKYFKALWNLVDIVVLLLSYLSFVYNILHPIYLKDILKKSQENPNQFWSIDKICFWNIVYIDVMGVCVFLVWIKIFKYISFNKTMLQFSTTLKRCAKDLCGFAVMFFIVFLAYAQLGLLIFGTSHPDFREFGISIITLMRMFLGDFEYQLIEEANHILGPIYFLTYVLFVFFILLNMFLAIINDTYGAVKSEVEQGHSHFGEYLSNILGKLYCCRRRVNDDIGSKSKKENRDPDDREASNEDAVGVEMESNSSHKDASSASVYPPSQGSTPPESERLRLRVSDLIREYFEELPAHEYELLKNQENPKDNYNLRRLTNRISLLEEVLEQLITDMDRILKKIESKQRNKSRK